MADGASIEFSRDMIADAFDIPSPLPRGVVFGAMISSPGPGARNDDGFELFVTDGQDHRVTA